MKITVKVRLKQLTKETLFEAYKKEKVLGYCKRCSNYGNRIIMPQLF